MEYYSAAPMLKLVDQLTGFPTVSGATTNKTQWCRMLDPRGEDPCAGHHHLMSVSIRVRGSASRSCAKFLRKMNWIGLSSCWICVQQQLQATTWPGPNTWCRFWTTWDLSREMQIRDWQLTDSDLSTVASPVARTRRLRATWDHCGCKCED